jgi:hypothetical protein
MADYAIPPTPRLPSTTSVPVVLAQHGMIWRDR